jgi:glycosyltransferase involved in cell wall biosynthesis/serine acetyltransferase
MAVFGEQRGSGADEGDLRVSVVIATYNRQDLLRRLLEQLDDQTLAHADYEVIAVDDGSNDDTRAKLADLVTRYALTIERQANAGAAVARQRGVVRARGKIVVIVDDDMQVLPTFLEKHLDKHEGDKTVVLGRLRPDARLADMPLFERFYARVLAEKAEAFAAGTEQVRGHDVYTGNVSFPRQFFLDAGGFDAEFRALEDEELGIRLEKAGARFVFANEAESIHGSDWTSMKAWMARAHRDGVYQAKVSRKHPDHPESSPWRHLPNLNPVSRPFMALSLAAPSATSFLAGAAIRTAAMFDKVGLEPVAIAGATFVYGLQYYRGVRQETGGIADVAREYREFKRGVALLRSGARGDAGAWKTLTEGVREDHRMIRFYADKYDAREKDGDEPVAPSASASAEGGPLLSLASDAVKKIGFQLMIAYRVMRFFRQAGLGLGAQFMSRSIRHAFASDVHWDAELEPGVVIVHGFGLAISYAAKVRGGCILFQNVTLGFGSDPLTKLGGAPELERNVHVGIGATLYGPIVVGESTKIMAGCVLSRSVPARSIVEAPVPQVAARAPARGPGNRV